MNLYLAKLANLDPQVVRDRFNPDLTPAQMETLGVLARQYYNKDPKDHNFFQIDASLQKWPEYWKNEQAPMGWYQWYQKYSAGERNPEEDLRQMRRWYLFKQRHLGGLKKDDPTLTDLSIRPRQRQSLLNWGIFYGDKDLALRAGNVNKYLEAIEKKKE